MAIVNISRIQHRRGYAENLPQLSHAEFGWVTDQRKLYIGNGPLSNGAPELGNTEILTEFSKMSDLEEYVYQGNAVAIVQTGNLVENPVYRSVQDKLDDHANISDFGAVGNGITDDSAAINRALTQLYVKDLSQKSRRILNFPPGEFIITETVNIPPNTTLCGAGSGKTIIKYTGVQTNAHATVSVNSGVVTGITINDGGSGYKTPPVAIISGNGTGAAAITVIDNGQVIAINIIVGGSGYTAASILISSTDIVGHDTAVVRTVDSLEQSSSNIGVNGAITPTNISIKGITFESTDNTDDEMNILKIDSTTNSIFDDVEFKGSLITRNINQYNVFIVRTDRPSGVVITTTNVLESTNIIFSNCKWTNILIGLYSNDNINNIKIINSSFKQLEKGIWLGEKTNSGTGPTNITINGTYFERIEQEGIDVDWSKDPGNVISLGNNYRNVGNDGDDDNMMGSGHMSNIININSNNVENCSSIGDTFYRTDYDNVQINYNSSSYIISNNFVQHGRILNNNSVKKTLLNNISDATTDLIYNANKYQTIKIKYRLERSNDVRFGVLTVVINYDDNVIFTDDYDEIGTTGVIFSTTHSSQTLTINYSTTDTGYSASLITAEEFILENER